MNELLEEFKEKLLFCDCCGKVILTEDQLEVFLKIALEKKKREEVAKERGTVLNTVHWLIRKVREEFKRYPEYFSFLFDDFAPQELDVSLLWDRMKEDFEQVKELALQEYRAHQEAADLTREELEKLENMED